MKQFDCPICVSGTHGKTSTTSMISEILLAADMDPTVSVGGILDAIGGNFRMGQSPFFVVESCEYCDSFLQFYPKIGIILNVDRDHLDYFRDLEDIQESFHHFAQNIPSDGTLVVYSGVPQKISAGLPCAVVTYGDDGADYTAADVVFDDEGFPSFTILNKGTEIGRVKLNVRGAHNILNSLAAAAAAQAVGAPDKAILIGLGHFSNAKRRFEDKGYFNGGVRVIDDYAHHPTEIMATLATAAKVPHHKIYCVFQPHTYTRTKALLDEFAHAFGDADKVLVLDIYAAREKDTGLVNSQQLAERIQSTGVDAEYFSTTEKARNFLERNCIPNDVLITLGAGDVYLLGESLVEQKLSTQSAKR